MLPPSLNRTDLWLDAAHLIDGQQPRPVLYVSPEELHRDVVAFRDWAKERLEQLGRAIPEPRIEAIEEPVLVGLSRRDVVPLNIAFRRPVQDRQAGEFRSVAPWDAAAQKRKLNLNATQSPCPLM